MTTTSANGSMVRFRKGKMCPVCGGSEDDERGQGRRCFGFTNAEKGWVHCSREEHAGKARHHHDSNTYSHRLKGECPCGVEHAPGEPAPVAAKGRKGTLDHVFKYRNLKGEVIFEVVRFKNPKGFAQRRPGKDARGQPLWGLKGVEPVLYNLPSLKTADPSEVVHVPEGEKHVDRLGTLGLLATTNPMGAGKWRGRYSEALKGRPVAVFPDNDDEGRKHAQQVASSLYGKAAWVKVVELPGLPPKGDVIDFLDGGGTVDQIRDLVRTTPEWKPPDRNGPAMPATSSNGHPAINLTEWGNALRLIQSHGTRLRYCKPLGLWLEWDGTRWAPDQTGAIWRWAKDTVRQLGHEAANTADDQRRQAILRWALKSEEKKVLSSMIELAWSEPGVSIMPDTLDRDSWLLNTPSGTVDLKTGKLRSHRQEDLISKITRVPFDPKAECPKWKKVIREIFADDQEMVAYVQRALGYSLTGFIGEHALFLCYGTGRNGKNTVLDTVMSLLQDYATVTNPRTFLAIGQNDHLAMVADLMGRRFVPTDEVEEGEQLAESVVKRLTGNKTLKARFMHKNPFEFPVLFKVWMLANCKPEIQGQDEGIWSRIRLIPFEVFFPPEKRIKGLSDILIAEEGPGILRWLVDGCLEWQRTGLAEPKKVTDAITQYRSEQDVIGDYVCQRCNVYLNHETLRDQAKTKAGALYGDYVAWCKENGEKKVLTNRRFASKIADRGFKLSPSNGVYYRLGITLKSDAETTSNGSSNDRAPF